jgi:quercetin dioxygenase-like cupin family protein
MNLRMTYLVLGVLTVGMAAPAQAQGVVVLPDQVSFKGLPGAPQAAVLFGDPTKAGLFVQRTKFTPGLKIMPHTHPDQPRTIVVLSGTLYFGLGEQWERAS